MDELRQAYIAESQELLASLDENLLTLEQNPADADALNAVFRAAHTIKGGAGIVECEYIVDFTHVLENALDSARDGRIKVDSGLIQLLLASGDQIARLLEFASDPEARPDAATLARGEELLAGLRAYSPGQAGAGGDLAAHPDAHVESSGGGMVGHDCWHISIRFGENVLREGMDPLSFLRYLAGFGEIAHLASLLDAMPAAEAMDPEACYLGFEIDFRADTSKEKIERVFDFVRDSCLLNILPPYSRVSEYVELIMSLPEDTMRLGEILVHAGAITPTELEQGLRTQSQAETGQAQTAPLGEILVEQQVVQKELVEAAVVKQAQVSDKKAQDAKLIRVHADKLDQLINLVGELVIAGASAALLAQKAKDEGMFEATSTISRLVDEIRDGALRLRMVQIGETFNRFHRVVRDVSRDLGKDIELVITGGEAELDKTVVEKISDPLTHMVRNAIDHGIESAEARIAAGKPARGRVHLNAFHESGNIVIEVSDDGGGLKRDRIKQKAIDKGLLSADAEPTDADLFKLLFEPGFSTADQISNLSGRGVGLDVVKRNIEALRGTASIDSREGVGTTMAIRLPLTLAIIDGFLMGVGKSAYVVPLDMVEECIELKQEETRTNACTNVLNLRGEVLPLIRLREYFALASRSGRRENVVVVKYAGSKAGLVVDELMGEFQTVIKPLGHIFTHLRGISGSTILGSGEVALILDVPSLITLATEFESGRRLAPALTLSNH
ncbi:MAG: chemotaxis protein CheA [Hydrogenophilales bacterium 28-61-23]|nr:MAG: chemotaxis protein CheA [Hydrogenophilales bacterium 28-61-23]